MTIKPCPFCGDPTAEATHYGGDNYDVKCGNVNCLASGPLAPTQREAIIYWNERVECNGR